MTDCHLTLPESLIMRTEALAENHSNYRNEGALALEFVLGERSSNRFFFAYHFQGMNQCFLPRDKQQASALSLVGLAFILALL